MPIYEYCCRNCGQVSEFFVGLGHKDEPLACKSCGSPDLEKMLSLSAVSTNREAPPEAGKCCERGPFCDSPKHCCTGGRD